jgi:hypothetical protein
MELLGNPSGVYRLARLLTLLALCQLFPYQHSGNCAFSPGAASAANDPYITVTVRNAKLVFVGSLVRLLPSPCSTSGLAPSRQGIVFDVRRILKGDSKLRGEITVYHSLTGNSPIEVNVDRCVKLSTQLFENGRDFIVACEQDPNALPGGVWVTIGGPWLLDRNTETLVAKAIAKGDITFPQQVWLSTEIEIERFIRGDKVKTEAVLRAIRFFDELTELPSSQSNKPIEHVSRAALQTDLDGWKAWYEKYGDSLAWDKEKSVVVVDKTRAQER